MNPKDLSSDELRGQLVALAIEWERRYGVCPAITCAVSELDAARLDWNDEAEPANIQHPVLLLRLNKLYRPEMSELELYEATRGIWKVSPCNCERIQYAFAVFHGLVQEVYEVHRWLPASTLRYETRSFSKQEVTRRWEFEGCRAPDGVRELYIHKSVRRYFKRGNRSPTIYVNV